MQIVRDGAAECVVVRTLTRLAVEAVVIARELPESNRASAGDDAGSAAKSGLSVRRANVSILRDEGLHERALRGVRSTRRRNDETTERGELRDVEMRSLRIRGNDTRDDVRALDSRILEVVELQRREALRVDDPRRIERSDLQR